jgi:hypothetical protein
MSPIPGMTRGASHQVDVLGEFALTPAFSLPIRMFLEAKFNRGPGSGNYLKPAPVCP